MTPDPGLPGFQEDNWMSLSAATTHNAANTRGEARDVDNDRPIAEPFLPVQLARTAEATGRLIGQGLIDRGLSGFALTDETGSLNPAIAPLAYAYEAALLTGLSPQEVRTLRRLLTRVEAAALKLSGR
jgi:hypothetical protein